MYNKNTVNKIKKKEIYDKKYILNLSTEWISFFFQQKKVKSNRKINKKLFYSPYEADGMTKIWNSVFLKSDSRFSCETEENGVFQRIIAWSVKKWKMFS